MEMTNEPSKKEFLTDEIVLLRLIGKEKVSSGC